MLPPPVSQRVISAGPVSRCLYCSNRAVILNFVVEEL